MTISASCVFLIGCKHKNEPNSGQIHPSDTNNSALAWVLKGDYQVVKSFYDLPKDVRIAILPEPSKSVRLGRMANPNERFNSTDVIEDDLPMRRFITGGFSKDYAFVFYEHGGRGYNQPFVILKREMGKANIILLAYLFEENGTMSLNQLKSIIKSNRIKEEKNAKYWSL